MLVLDHPFARSINLMFNVVPALAVPWLQWPRSIAGDWSSIRLQLRGLSTEYDAVFPDERAALETWLRITPVLGRVVREKSGPIPALPVPDPIHPRERWLFVNGICTDTRVAELNVQLLSALFARPITLLHNRTDGVIADLVECALGKSFDSVTDSVAENLPSLVDALVDPGLDRVVLLAHSQGTILASVMLKWLDELISRQSPRVRRGVGVQKVSPERRAARKLAGLLPGQRQHPQAKAATAKAQAHGLGGAHIGKLEVYCFANCATSMAPIAVVQGAAAPHYAPWIESYGNEHDVVARLGLLAPPHGIGSARIEGDRYRCDDAWGHLLNAHYLIPMVPHMAGTAAGPSPWKAIGKNLRNTPRLWGYFGGATPPPYP